MSVPIFSGKGIFCSCLSQEDFPKKNLKRGVFINQSPTIWGIFQKFPEKLRKRGCFPEPAIASQEIRVGPLFYCIYVIGPPRVM